MKLFPLRLIFFFALLLPPLSLAAIAQVAEATLKLSLADAQINSVSGASIEITNAPVERALSMEPGRYRSRYRTVGEPKRTLKPI
jgi:hypothetical protein